MMERSAAISGSIPSANARARQRALLEVSVVYALILLVLWTPDPWQTLFWGIALALMMAITCKSFTGMDAMGLGATNFRRSLWAVGLAFAMAVVAVVLAGNLHTLHMPANPLLCIRHYGGYALWAFIQQFGLQCFFLSRLIRLLPDGKSAAAVAAILFATVHLPSPLLMLAALIWGFVACLLFLEYRTLYPLVIAHAILGIALGISVPAQADHNMLVGLSYFKYMHNAAKAPPLSQP
jgi:hypothetical protein